MIRRTAALASLFLFLTSGILFGQYLTGTLPDGMTYYIQRNTKPDQRIQLGLVVHAGSVQEKTSQRGIAHLLEHMEFQGTEHFAPQAIVHFLESNGMKFGADLNAQTGFTSTQFFLEIPSQDTAKDPAKGPKETPVFQTALQILDDWAHGPVIVPSVLENEKKVVQEEARMRMDDVQGRITNFLVPYMYAGSPYADKLPIGSMKIVRSATPQTVEDFCHTWYRPENMAIFVIGDLQPETVRQELLAKFTDPLRKPENRTGPDAPDPVLTDREAKIFQDKELTTPTILWAVPSPAPQKFLAWTHFELLHALVSRILNTRLDSLSRQENAPFQGAGVDGHLSFGHSWEEIFSVEPFDGRLDEGLTAFVRELQRARLHGFTPTDFHLAVKELKSEIETAYAQRGGLTDEDRFQALAQNFLTGFPVVSDKEQYEAGLSTLSSITLPELNQFAATLLAYPKFRMAILNPEKPGTRVPEGEHFLKLVAQVQAEGVKALANRTVLPLMPTLPSPGAIVQERHLTTLGVTEYQLANGAVVYAKQTDFTPHEVLLNGQRLGGLSLIDTKDLLSVEQAPSLFSQTGLGPLDASQLSDFLAGKQVQLRASVGTSGVYLSGSAATSDLETLFQLLHEQLGPPHRDPSAEAAWFAQMRDYLKNADHLPRTLAQRALERLLTQDNPRGQPLTAKNLSQVNADKAALLWGQLLKNPNGLVLSIVGDFDPAQLQHLIRVYVASLPPGPATPPHDWGIRPVSGPETTVIAQGQDNRAENTLVMINPRPFRPDDRFAANTLKELLNIRLRDVLRNENGGTYNAQADVSLSPLPYPHATAEVAFTCAPARQKALDALALGVLNSVVQDKFAQTTFAQAKAIAVRGVQGYLKRNAFWSAILPEYSLKGYPLEELAGLSERYSQVTRAQVVDLAREVLTTSRALEVVLKPAP